MAKVSFIAGKVRFEQPESNIKIGSCLDYAYRYIDLGLPVFPVHGIVNGVCTCGDITCKSPGKHPLTKNGFKDATLSKVQASEWWLRWPHANIAIPMGKASGLFALDIDVKPGVDGNDVIAALEEKHGKLPDTVEAITGSGGRHILFKLPDHSIRTGTNILGLGVDVRAEGSYIVVEPAKHIMGNYVWEASSDPLDGVAFAEASLWLLELLKVPSATKGSATVSKAHILLTAGQILELRAALAVVPADDYDLWLRVGMALHSAGDCQQTFGLWCEWSQLSDKYDASVQAKKWASFSEKGLDGVSVKTIFMEAQQRGWINQSVIAQKSPVKKPSPTIKELNLEYPIHLLKVPGVLGEFSTWITDTAIRPQQQFSVASALSFGATVASQKFRTSTGSRSNLYLFLIGPSSSGKEHPIQCLKHALEQADLGKLIAGEQLKSGPGVYTAIAANPKALFVVDEFGEFMLAAGKIGAMHKADAITALMTVFSKTNSIHRGAPSADSALNPRQDIFYPCVNFVTTTTPRNFYDSITMAHVANGFIGRTLFVEIDHRPTKIRQLGQVEVPELVISWAKDILSMSHPDKNLIGFNAESPIEVPLNDAALSILNEFDHFLDTQMLCYQETGLDAAFGKGGEHAAKIALLLCLSRNNEVIDEDDMQWSVDFVKYHINHMIYKIERHIGDTPFQRRWKACLGQISDKKGHGVTRREMGRYGAFSRLTPKEADEVILHLEQSGLIELQSVATRGRPRIAYIAVSKKAEDEETE